MNYSGNNYITHGNTWTQSCLNRARYWKITGSSECFRWIKKTDLCLFPCVNRESTGALHYGSEPLIFTGAGVSDAVSPHVSALGHPAHRPETRHLPQQELPGSAAWPRPAAEGKTQNMHPAVKENKQDARAGLHDNGTLSSVDPEYVRLWSGHMGKLGQSNKSLR